MPMNLTEEQQAVKEYAELLFSIPLISDDEIAQLSWSIRSAAPTPEKAIIDVSGNPGYMEIKRCLSRLYCLTLLKSDSEENFEKFRGNQPRKEEYNPALEFAQYQELAQKFKNRDELFNDALRVTTIISSVPLSPRARERADAVLGKNNYTIDSVEFLSETFSNIDNAKQIYPAVAALFEKYPEPSHQQRLVKLLQSAFSSGRHFRHMMYTEGNETMFEGLLKGIRAGEITPEEFEFWLCHWNINITGFRGHIEPKGSLYLTSNTFRAMQALEGCLVKIFAEDNLNARELLNRYLDIRAGEGFIDLGELPDRTLAPDEKRILSHVGAMMRLFHPLEGKALLEGYRYIPKSLMKELTKAYFSVPAANEPTPTYAPALYENAIDFRRKMYRDQDTILRQVHSHYFDPAIKYIAENLIRLVAIADVIVGMLPINLAALQAYRAKRQAGGIAEKQPLSFMALAAKKEVIELCGESPIFKQFNILRKVDITIAENGAVGMQEKSANRNIQRDPSYTPRYSTRLQTRRQQEDLGRAQEQVLADAAKRVMVR